MGARETRGDRRRARGGIARLLTLAAAWAVAVLVIAPGARADPRLSLVLAKGIGEREIGDVVFVTLDLADLGGREIAGWQAFLEFDRSRLLFLCGQYTADAFGLPIIDPIAAVDGRIDLAAGVDIANGQPPQAYEGELAILQFAVLQEGCAGGVWFRESEPPTRLTDDAGGEVGPLTLLDLPEQDPCDPSPCQADYNEDWRLNSLDFVLFLNLFVAGDRRADFNGDCTLNSVDFIAYLNAFVAGCY